MEMLMNEAKGCLGNDTKAIMDDMLKNFGDSDTIR
jgi:hypothetical protein